MTRSDAIKILDSIWVKGIWRKTNEIDWNKAGDAIDMATDALKVDIVHCEECKHWKRYDTTIFKGPAFAPCLRSDGMNAFTAKYDYCSHGVRREL